MPLTLEDIRVIDLAQALAGPGSSMYLADQGADVIKIEPPEGDESRAQSNDPLLGDYSRGFMVLNRNKRSVTLDIRKPEGREVLFKLAARSDVLITNLRAKTAQRLGVDYPTLHKLYPRLIYGHVTGWGTVGPYADKGGYDRLTQGMSGAMYRRWADGTPVTAGLWVSDPSVPMLIAYGVMLALWNREKTGVGQKVETSLLQAAIAMQNTFLVRVEKAEKPFNSFESATYGIYKCGDGAYINVTALRQRQADKLFEVLDLPHLAKDPRSRDPGRRDEFRNEVYPVIEAVFATKTSKEWLALLDEADIPAAPILDREQVFDEPQILENGMIVRVDHPRAGPVQMFGVPINLSDTPGVVRKPAPLLGEDTDQVLGELGYDTAAIADLRARGII